MLLALIHGASRCNMNLGMRASLTELRDFREEGGEREREEKRGHE